MSDSRRPANYENRTRNIRVLTSTNQRTHTRKQRDETLRYVGTGRGVERPFGRYPTDKIVVLNDLGDFIFRTYTIASITRSRPTQRNSKPNGPNYFCKLFAKLIARHGNPLILTRTVPGNNATRRIT